MFCPRCGTQNETGAAFCRTCGGRMPREEELDAPAPASKPMKKHTGLLVGVLVAVAATAAAFATFFLLIYPRLDELRAQVEPESPSAAQDAEDASAGGEETEPEPPAVSQRELLLAGSVSAAGRVGQMAGSQAFLQDVAGLSAEVFAAARTLAPSGEITGALVCEDLPALLRARFSDPDSPLYRAPDGLDSAALEQAYAVLGSSLGTYLNGTLGGAELLAAASALTVGETIALPEPLAAAALVIVRYDGGPDLFVTFTPAGGTAASVSCVPADGAADDAWAQDQARAALAGAADADRSMIGLYSSDPELTAMAQTLLQSIRGEATWCEVYSVSRTQLLDLAAGSGETLTALEQAGLTDSALQLAAASLPNQLAGTLGAVPLAASTIMARLVQQTPYAVPAPADFDGCRLVAMTWPDGVATVTALYDGGNGFVCAATAFLISDAPLAELPALYG